MTTAEQIAVLIEQARKLGFVEAQREAARIVKAKNTCGCRPGFCECHGYSTLDAIHEAILNMRCEEPK